MFMRVLLGCDINCRIPPGLYLGHPYGITIHSATRIGRDVTIMQHVTIGANLTGLAGSSIGDRVFIGAGAAIIGKVNIGEDAVLGANAVVTKDVPPRCIVVGANRIVRVRDDVASL
jgi:serine O-acetyltransferase